MSFFTPKFLKSQFIDNKTEIPHKMFLKQESEIFLIKCQTKIIPFTWIQDSYYWVTKPP